MIQAFFSGVSFALGVVTGIMGLILFIAVAFNALESFASRLEENFREMEEVELEVEK